MYNAGKGPKTTLKGGKAILGERIEQKILRITTNKEPITDGAPIIFTQRKDGVRPELDIRTDRWEVALDATDKIAKHHIAKREENIKKFNEQTEKFENKGDGKTESTGGTEAPK